MGVFYHARENGTWITQIARIYAVVFCAFRLIHFVREIRVYFDLTAAKPNPFGPTCVPITVVTLTIKISRGKD